MRLLLILVCALLLAGTAWFSVQRGTEGTSLKGAPQIENMVDQGVREALGEENLSTVDVRTDGRNVTLSGTAIGEETHDELLAAARETRLLGRLTDKLDVLALVSPFTFVVTKQSDGALALSGHVPSRDIEEALLSQARALSSGQAISSRLVLAAGAPDTDWIALAGAGLEALGEMQAGEFSLSDLEASLSGTVAGEAESDQLIAIVMAAPGTWSTQIEGMAPLVDPYKFTALKTTDGAVIIGGNAPDEAARDALVAAAQEITPQPVDGTLDIARGMPGADWPVLVQQGLRAVAATNNGLLTISGRNVDLAAEVVTNDDLAALEPLIGAEWRTEIKVLNPPPDAGLRVTLARDGKLTGAGLLPRGLSVEAFTAILPGIDFAPVVSDTPPDAADWTPALDALNILLPRFREATALIEGNSLSIEGQLKRGFSAEGSAAAVRTAVPRAWSVNLDLQESPPLAELVLSKRGGDTVLSGVLPMGLAPDVALNAFDEGAGGEGLTGGGEGSAEDWKVTLDGTSGALAFFDEVSGKITTGKIDLDGTLGPGYTPNQLSEWLESRIAPGWVIGLNAVETEAGEGDSRMNLNNGEPEDYRGGYWLPRMEFPVSQARCNVEIDEILAREKIQFVTASARIDQEGRVLLNRLAAVAVRCLNSSIMQLEIGGHTDSVGNDETNLKLSQARADAVRDELVSRGVRVEAMSAIGFGEADPIASNDLPEGRAENRRITFKWSSGQD